MSKLKSILAGSALALLAAQAAQAQVQSPRPIVNGTMYKIGINLTTGSDFNSRAYWADAPGDFVTQKTPGPVVYFVRDRLMNNGKWSNGTLVVEFSDKKTGVVLASCKYNVSFGPSVWDQHMTAQSGGWYRKKQSMLSCGAAGGEPLLAQSSFYSLK